MAIVYKNKECHKTEGSRPAKALKPTTRTESEKWVLNSKFPEQTITLGLAVSENTRAHLKQLLTKNKDIFAWQHADMTGVPRHLAEHRLNTYKSVAPIA